MIRESGGDRSAVTGSTTVISDQIKVRITAGRGSRRFWIHVDRPGQGAERQKTAGGIALNILLAGMTIIFVFAVAGGDTFRPSLPMLMVKSRCWFWWRCSVNSIPTTIGALLSAIGIGGMDRLVRFNVLAMSGRAGGAAGDVDTLLLDKTGGAPWVTARRRNFCPFPAWIHATWRMRRGSPMKRRKAAPWWVLAKEKYGIRGREMAPLNANFIPFSAQTRVGGIGVSTAPL